ncbi:unnamed protein product [Hermetia illucens]|uniref:Integrase zinc-binding domain-containing protein n=1 Tax=Hermetia illucens TaxID=343691 RepID=A0A7R8UDG3_HERIL|nr:unnamed protein product [Hermetia illucens]
MIYKNCGQHVSSMFSELPKQQLTPIKKWWNDIERNSEQSAEWVSIKMTADNAGARAATQQHMEENFNNHITIKEDIVNKYQQQLFLVENEESRHQMTSTIRRRTVITSKQLDTPDKAINFLKIRLQPGTVAIYSEIDDHQYNKLQQIILEVFDNTVTKFIKVTQIVKEITNGEDLIDRIKYYHEKETGHAGIRENYSELKNQKPNPNLYKYIHRYINACQICNENKVDRKPIKPKLLI